MIYGVFIITPVREKRVLRLLQKRCSDGRVIVSGHVIVGGRLIEEIRYFMNFQQKAIPHDSDVIIFTHQENLHP